jgi:hypothetical protein
MLEGGQEYTRMFYGENSESKEVASIKAGFEQYLQEQIAKIDVPDKDEAFLRERMLTMYANPLRNFLKVKNK